MTQHIAIHGKGGVGKTTLAANLSAALAEAGCSVVVVGCDFKADTGTLLHGYASVPTLLEHLDSAPLPPIPEIVTVGYRGVACIEVGDSIGGEGCAAARVGKALELFRELRIVEKLTPDYVLYDAPVELGCVALGEDGGPASAYRSLIVTSGDLHSFHSANAFFRVASRQSPPAGGALVGNGIAGKFEESFVEDFAAQIGSPVLLSIPRSLVVRHCELYGKTVMEAAPDSTQAHLYRRLARQVIDDRTLNGCPKAVPAAALKEWARGWGDRLGELEFGIIRDGAGI